MKITRKKIVNFIIKNGGAAGWTKAAAGVVSLALLTGGTGVLWNQIQAGAAFQPGKSSALQGLRSNQVMFPEKDAPGSGNDSNQSDKNDDKRLEADDNADEVKEGMKPENQPDTPEGQQSLLDMAQNVMVLPGQANAGQDGTAVPNLDGKTVQIYDGTSTDSSSHPGSVLPGYSANIGSSSSGNSGVGKENGSSGGSGSGSDGGNPSSGEDPGGTGTQPGGNGTETPVTPTPEPTPNPDPVPTPEPIPDPDSPPVDPDYPNENEGPKLPEDPGGYLPIEADKYPSMGLPSSENQSNVELMIMDVDDMNSGAGETLYQGAVLTDWKLLCAVYAYVEVDGTLYRLKELNDCFKVEGYPKVADGNFTVTFSFRQNPEIPWEDEKYVSSVEHEFQIKYGKIILMGEADSDGKREKVKTTFLDEKTSISVAGQLMKLYDANPDWGSRDEFLSEIVPGVSFSEDGSDPIFDWIDLKQGGRYILYPLERQPVPDGMKVRFYEEYNDTARTVICKQTLVDYPEQETVKVPEGIYAVSLENEDTSAGRLEIPVSVMEIKLPAHCVRDGYEVAPENQYYASSDGMLFNKSETEILGVPWTQTELVVPEGVEKVGLESGNSIHKLMIQTETIPEIDISTLKNAEIVVPAEHYAAYQLAWGDKLGEGTTLVADGDVEDTIYENNAVVSSDGKTLYAISENVSGLYRMSDRVETIEPDATYVSTLEEGIYMPAGVKHLKKESLSGTGVRRIYFTGETPPEIEQGAFGDPAEAFARGLEIIVPSAYEEAWQEALAPVLGDYAWVLIKPMSVSLEDEDSGLSYLLTDEGAVLLHAPAETESFAELETKSGQSWIRIGALAFEDCQKLSVVELPETVSEIESWAFADCDNLDLIMVPCMDTVKIGLDPFPLYSSIAVNTQNVELEDASTLDYIYLYGSYSCTARDREGDEYEINRWGLSYQLEKAETGWFLFGIDKEQDTGKDISYLIGVTRDMSGAIRGAEGCLLRQIGYYTFMDHEPEITIPDEVAAQIQYINPYAFYNSGLTGEVKLSKGLALLAEFAFAECENLKNVRFDGTTDLPEKDLSLGDGVFDGSGVEEIVFGNIKSIRTGCFMGADSLRKLVFTGKTPPTLVLYSVGSSYMWGWEDREDVPEICLEDEAEGEEETYIEKWMYPVIGYDSGETLENDLWVEAFANIFEFLPEDQWLAFDMDGYLEDYVAAKSILAEYEAKQLLYPLFNREVPEKPDVEIPKIEDYVLEEVEDEVPPYELVLPEEIVTEPEQPGVNGNVSDSGEIEVEDPDEDGEKEEEPLEDDDKEEPSQENPDAGDLNGDDLDVKDPDGENSGPDDSEQGGTTDENKKGDSDGANKKDDTADDSGKQPEGDNKEEESGKDGDSSPDGNDEKEESGTNENGSGNDKDLSESGEKDTVSGEHDRTEVSGADDSDAE